MDLIIMSQGTQKSLFYFSRDHGWEVTVNNVSENQYFPCFDPQINKHLR